MHLCIYIVRPLQAGISFKDTCKYSCLFSRFLTLTWWCHKIETVSALLTLWAGKSPVNSSHRVTVLETHPHVRQDLVTKPSWMLVHGCVVISHCCYTWIEFMMTSSNGNTFRVTGHLCGEFIGPGEFPHKGQWRGALMFSLICTRINGWVNNGEAGDLIRHRAHYDVIVMYSSVSYSCC